MKLSPHFTLAELTKSQTAIRLGISNVPDDIEIKNLKALAENILEPIRSRFGPFSPNSGFRSPDLNAAIGGSKTSQHMTGEAADIEVSGVSNRDLAEWIAVNLEFDQLILEYHDPAVPSSGWVHVSYRLPNRGMALTIDSKGTRKGLASA